MPSVEISLAKPYEKEAQQAACTVKPLTHVVTATVLILLLNIGFVIAVYQVNRIERRNAESRSNDIDRQLTEMREAIKKECADPEVANKAELFLHELKKQGWKVGSK